MKIDVLQFLALPDKSPVNGMPNIPARQTHILGQAGDIITPIDSSGYGQWKHIKNPRGWPWDLKLYDEHYIYDWVTEGAHGWSSDIDVGPKSFKKFIGNHMTAGRPADGLPMFPRYVDTVATKSDMSFGPDQTNYAVFENCIQVGTPVSLGSVRQVLRGPFALYHGGDVGMQPTLIHQYYWSNNGIPTLEENYYALHWGWVRWSLQELDPKSGFYRVKNETVSVNWTRVIEVKIVFPCF